MFHDYLFKGFCLTPSFHHSLDLNAEHVHYSKSFVSINVSKGCGKPLLLQSHFTIPYSLIVFLSLLYLIIYLFLYCEYPAIPLL